MIFIESKINGFLDNSISNEVHEIISSIEFQHQKNSSPFLREILQYEFNKMNWYSKFKVDSRLNWYVQFYAKETAILFYFSNKARSSLDLIKIQHLYANEKIKGAIYIVLTSEAAIKVASNLANFETLEKEIRVFKETISCPILLIGLQ